MRWKPVSSPRGGAGEVGGKCHGWGGEWSLCQRRIGEAQVRVL